MESDGRLTRGELFGNFANKRDGIPPPIACWVYNNTLQVKSGNMWTDISLQRRSSSLSVRLMSSLSYPGRQPTTSVFEFNFTTAWIKFSLAAELKQKFEAYYFLQFRDLQVLLMNLLILHLQNFFQTLQVLLDVFIRCQSILVTAHSNINNAF